MDEKTNQNDSVGQDFIELCEAMKDWIRSVENRLTVLEQIEQIQNRRGNLEARVSVLEERCNKSAYFNSHAKG